MSPQMQAYFQQLGYNPQESLIDAPPNPMARFSQQNRRRYPQQDQNYGRHFYRNINDDDDDDSSSKLLFIDCSVPVFQLPRAGDEVGPSLIALPHRAQPATPPRRPQAERPGNLDDSFYKELETLSPEMRRYVERLMKQRNGSAMPSVQYEGDIQDRMATLASIGFDAEISRPPGRIGHRVRPRNPSPPARGTRLPPFYEKSSEDDSESDEGSVPPHGRTIITNTDRQNVNSAIV